MDLIENENYNHNAVNEKNSEITFKEKEEREIGKIIQLYKNKKYSLKEAQELSGFSREKFLKTLTEEKNKSDSAQDSFSTLSEIYLSKKAEIEEKLIVSINYLQNGMFDVEDTDVRKLKHEILSEYNIKLTLNEEVGKVSEKRIKSPPKNVSKYLFGKMNDYFDTFTKIYNNHNIDSTRIYYLEVTKLANQFLLIYCVNATGCRTPNPMIILNESPKNNSLKNDSKLSKKFFIATSQMGKLTNGLFTKWLESFVLNSKVTPERKVILYLDGNNSQCKCYKSIKLAINSGIILIQIPTYKTMHLQPLLMTLVKSFITMYSGIVKSWFRDNSEQTISLKVYLNLLLKVYDVKCEDAFGFQNQGIWPLDKRLFFNSFEGLMEELKQTEDFFGTEQVESVCETIGGTKVKESNSELLVFDNWEDNFGRNSGVGRTEISTDGDISDSSKNSSSESENEKQSNVENSSFAFDISSVRFSRVHCTGCDIHLGSAPAQVTNMFEHPKLRTLLCLKCYEFYGDGDFEQGDDQTDMFCRWCANGGNLYCCSDCSNTFCSKCVKRNFDAVIAKKIEDDEKWKCFVCDPTDIYPARSLCRAIIQHVQTVCRILQNDKTMNQVEVDEKMNLDESRCCSRKRKRKRRKTGSGSEDDDDETYNPVLSEMPQVKRRRTRKSGQVATPVHTNGSVNNQSDDDSSLLAGDNDLLAALIPCEQTMTEGDTALPFGSPTKVQPQPSKVITTDKLKTQILSNNTKPNQTSSPVLNLLKPMKVRRLTPVTTVPHSQLRTTLLNPLSQPHLRPNIIGPTSQIQVRQNMVRPISHLQPRAMLIQKRPNRPMVSIPQPRTPGAVQQSKPRILLPKSRQTNITTPTPNIIDIESDSDEGVEVIGASDRVTRNKTAQMSKDDQKTNKNFEQLILNQKHDIDIELQSLRKKFNFVLSDSPTKATNDEASLKMKKFQQVMRKTLYRLAQINDRVVREYHSWKKQTTTEDTEKPQVDYFPTKNPDVSLEMICVRDSESESDGEGTILEASNLEANQLNCYSNLTLFRKKRTVEQAVGDDSIEKHDKSVQAYDVRTRDYEKSIGYSLLMKAEYDPKTEKEVLKPVEVLNEHFGKFQEQFIFHLQHIEENGIKTTEDLENLPDPNETPLKDLIEANSPFIAEMLENIPPTVINGSATESEAIKENSDEEMPLEENDAKESPSSEEEEEEEKKDVESDDEDEKEKSDEEEDKNESPEHLDSTAATSKAVEELVKMVTKLSDELKSSNNSPENTTLSSVSEKNESNDEKRGGGDHEKDEETVLAVRTLVEEENNSGNNFTKTTTGTTETSAIEECNFLN